MLGVDCVRYISASSALWRSSAPRRLPPAAERLSFRFVRSLCGGENEKTRGESRFGMLWGLHVVVLPIPAAPKGCFLVAFLKLKTFKHPFGVAGIDLRPLITGLQRYLFQDLKPSETELKPGP